MKSSFLILTLIGGLVTAAGAQVPSPSPGSSASAASGVRISTDPARAAAVEKHAQALKQQAGSQPGILFRGKADSGIDILSGGVSVGDRVAMHQEQGRYSLWVATVAKPSGAYLANVRLRIVKQGDGSVMLDRTLEGPWLFASLPAGRYDVSAAFKGDGMTVEQTLTQRVVVPGTGLRQVVLRFDSPAQVGSEMDSPVDGNPFGAASARR